RNVHYPPPAPLSLLASPAVTKALLRRYPMRGAREIQMLIREKPCKAKLSPCPPHSRPLQMNPDREEIYHASERPPGCTCQALCVLLLSVT
ncbi:hypothetical protein KUCAC02_025445, partial [Chaenocephalus aceratus]